MVDNDGAELRGLPLEQLAELQRAFETLLASADPEAPVPSCGAWTVRELAEHLSSVHIWAAGKVLRQKLQLPDPDPAVPDSSVSGAHTVAARYGAGAETLRKALASVPPDQPCQTLTGDGPASFWQRRQTHETLIHLWDLSHALGAPMPSLAPQVWADCVAEVVQVMHPRQVRLGRADAPEHGLLLVAEDTGHRWSIPAGEPAAEPAAVITAAAAELARLLWGRGSLDDVNLRGDRSAAAAVLAGALTP